MKSGKTNMIDKNHNEQTSEGFIKESWIKKEIDPVFPDEKNGAWIVGIKIENDETWQEIKKGEITGLSMQGIAAIEQEAPGTLQGEETRRSCGFDSTGFFEKIKKIAVSLNKVCLWKDFVDKSDVKENPVEKQNSDVINEEKLTEKIECLINKIDDIKQLFDKKNDVIEKAANKTKQILENGSAGKHNGWKWL